MNLYKDQLEIVAVQDMTEKAIFYPCRKVVIIYNKRNGTKNIFVFSQELDLIAAPLVWEGDENLVSFVREALG